jgi:signal peptidase I
MLDLRESARARLVAEAMQRSGRIAMRVYGTSMIGAIWPGDEVEFERCTPAQVETGDVLLSCRDGRIVVHRVVQIARVGDQLRFLTRGDNQRACDLPLSEEQVLGRALWLTRGCSLRLAIPKRRSAAARFASWFTARSILLCELALRFHAVREWVRSTFSSQAQYADVPVEASR